MNYRAGADPQALAGISIDVKKLVFNKLPYLLGQRFGFGSDKADALVLPAGDYTTHEQKGLLGWRDDGRADGAREYAGEYSDEVARCLAALGLDATREEWAHDPQVFGRERLTSHEFVVQAELGGEALARAASGARAEQLRHVRELAAGADEALAATAAPARLADFVAECFDGQLRAVAAPNPTSLELCYTIDAHELRVYAGAYPALGFDELGAGELEGPEQIAGMRALVLEGVVRRLAQKPRAALVWTLVPEFQFGHGGVTGDLVTVYFGAASAPGAPAAPAPAAPPAPPAPPAK